ARQDTRVMVRLLRRERVEVVLAEYGPSAVSVMTACREANVPLIVHFHGYDAYRMSLVAELKENYAALFQQAAAVIAVSTHMQQQLRALGAPAETLFHNACGADIPTECVANPSQSAPICLMVGR